MIYTREKGILSKRQYLKSEGAALPGVGKEFLKRQSVETPNSERA